MRIWRVGFVRADVLFVGFRDRLIEASQQLEKGLTLSAYQHGHGDVVIARGGNASDGTQSSHGDFAISNQVRDMGQPQGGGFRLLCGVLF